ncbi:MAG: hypothetical protein WEB00_14345 [Dehalococcoidia bacterium]
MVVEGGVAGWNLTGIVCQDPDGGTSVDLPGRAAIIDVDEGESITCNFMMQQAPPPVDRKVIFVQGIDSFSGSCGAASRSNVKWLVDYIIGPNGSWIREVAPTLNSAADFIYFSYSYMTPYCKDNGVENYRKPSYQAKDTCVGVKIAASRLQSLATKLVAKYPNARFDIVAHSMGAMVASYWLTTRPQMQSRVNSVITFDGVLRGVPHRNVLSSACPKDSRSWLDLKCNNYYQAQDPDRCVSRIVSAIARAGVHSGVPFYTIDATQKDEVSIFEVDLQTPIEFVKGNRTTLLASRSRLHCRFDNNHSSVWRSPFVLNDPVECWVDVLTAANTPTFSIASVSDFVKPAFVGCAITRAADPQACLTSH